MIRTEVRAGERIVRERDEPGGCVQRRRFKEATAAVGEQLVDFALERCVARAGVVQECGARGGRHRQRLEEQILNPLPSLTGHGGSGPSPRPPCAGPEASSRRSHALATFQSRVTVSVEMSSAAAVSSTLNPPKKRISTT